MLDQKYPAKAPYHNWVLTSTNGDLEQQLLDWHSTHPSYAITQHQYTCDNEHGIEALILTYFDLDEAEKDVEEEFRTPRNQFYFKKIVSPLQSDMDSNADNWYNENNIDIISKSSWIDFKSSSLVTGFVYVDRTESEKAFEEKKQRQQKQVQQMANKMAGVKDDKQEQKK